MTHVEAALVTFRFLQFGAASILCGSALFLLLFVPGPALAAWHLQRLLLPVAAVILALASAGGLLVQTAILAGSIDEALKLPNLALVIGTMDLGKAAVVRMSAGLAAFLCLAVPRIPVRIRWVVAAVFGAIATVSFAWSGHGAATDGSGHALHLAADFSHALAAGFWIGALVVFALLVSSVRGDPAKVGTLHQVLARFSGVGTWLVAIIFLTGAVNTWFLAGSDVSAILTSPYGRLLALKLGAFSGMLLLAAAHRWWLVPALAGMHSGFAGPGEAQLRRLKLSITAELSLGLVVLTIVSWLGTLEPPAL